MLFGAVHLVAQFLERLFGLVNQAIGFVLSVNAFALGLVAGGVGFRVLDHLVDLFLAQAGRRSDSNVLVFSCSQVLGAYVYDAVRVNVKGDFDLRNAAGSRRNSVKVEVAQSAVLGGHLALALQYVDCNGGLAVGGCREYLALLCRNRRVAVDELSHYAAHGFDSQRKRGYVKQNDVLYVALQNAALNRGSDGYRFVGVDRAASLFSKKLFHYVLNFGHAA